MKKKFLLLLLAAAMTASMFSGCLKKTAVEDKETIEVLNTWQGGVAEVPDDQLNNPIAQKIREATGVSLNILTNNVSETEKLNVVFGSGEMPDLILAPMWGGQDAATLILKKAAKEGLLMPLDDLVEKYGPNVAPNLSENLADAFRMFDVEDPEFEGKHYFITGATPQSEVEGFPTTNPSGFWIRKDIFEALNVDRDSIRNSEDIYELLKKIKAGNFLDVNGKAIIPGGLQHSGEGEGSYYASYNCNTSSGYKEDTDGGVIDVFYDELLDKSILFMRRLFLEDLIDKEGMNQNASQATEKIATGRYGIVPASYQKIKSITVPTLNVTNPEMEYIPLCSKIPGPSGKKLTRKLKGSSGAAIMCIPATSKKAESVMKVLNYLMGDEGNAVALYGIEGVHSERNENGFLRFTKEWQEIKKNDPDRVKNEGLGGIFSRMSGRNLKKTRYGFTPEEVASTMDPEVVAAAEIFEKGWENYYADGILINFFESQYPKIDDIRLVKSYQKMVEARLKGYFAKTEADALSYTNDLRTKFKDVGIEDLWKFLEEKAEATKAEGMNILY